MLPVYCCGALDYQVQSEFCPIKYNSQWREYSVKDFKSTSLSLVLFCPNCGTKLPSSLRNEWFDILEQEYGLEDPCEEDKQKLPQEFLTDEWWKSRGFVTIKEKNVDCGLMPNRPIRCLF